MEEVGNNQVPDLLSVCSDVQNQGPISDGFSSAVFVKIVMSETGPRKW